MKNIFNKAPLFTFIYVSLILICIGAQFDNPLREIYPDFYNKLNDININVTNAINTTTYKLSNLEDQQTVNVFVPIETGDIVEDSKIMTLSETPPVEEEPELPVETEPADPTPPYVPMPEITGPYYIQSEVDQSYFDDALFIGDSRTVGMQLYSGWENTDFLADVGLTIYGVLNKEITFNGGSKVTASSVLTSKRYSKIYMMLGINEVGTGSSDSFCESYKEVIDQILEWQPNAIIVVQSIMCVGPQKSATHPSINNPNIRARNEKLSTLQNDWNIYYLDINPAVCDENGDLISSYSFDQVHLYAQYYYLWSDYLLQHGYILNQPKVETASDDSDVLTP